MKDDNFISWDLLMRHMEGTLSEDEERRFNEWLAEDSSHEVYYRKMVAEWNSELLHERNVSRLSFNFDSLMAVAGKQRRRAVVSKIIGWSAAAVLLISIGLGALWFAEQDKLVEEPAVLMSEITPAQGKARLVMYDGTSVNLEKEADSSSLVVGSTKIVNSNGTVSIENDDRIEDKIEYNTIYVPRNGEYNVLLSDGTAVWLNAESSLKFPTRFDGGKRHVILSGEGYFMVSHNEEMPFVVETDLGEVMVYGTEFNVRRNVDENMIRVTLVNGSVGFHASGKSNKEITKIEPGYQVSYASGEDVVVKKVKVFNEVAWRDHLFNFEHYTLDEIMKDVARWYDVDVFFVDESLGDLYFTCALDRYDKIEKLLRFFEEVYDITFKVEGKNVIVMRKEKKSVCRESDDQDMYLNDNFSNQQ